MEGSTDKIYCKFAFLNRKRSSGFSLTVKNDTYKTSKKKNKQILLCFVLFWINDQLIKAIFLIIFNSCETQNDIY